MTEQQQTDLLAKLATLREATASCLHDMTQGDPTSDRFRNLDREFAQLCEYVHRLVRSV